MSLTERSNITFFLLVTSLVFCISYFLISVISLETGTVAGKTTNHPPVLISFFFGGGGQFKIYGYSSPQALVSLESGAGFDETRAKNNGYFEFANRYSPVSPQEVCLTAQDQFGRLSNPTCLPSFPNDSYVEIGPVVLSPTLSFDKTDYFIGDKVVLSGQTIPNTDVNLSLFTKTEKEISNFKFQISNLIIKPVEAFSFPNLTTKSDSEGNYSISLPSSSAKTYRLFTQVNYEAQSSPKSHSLQFQILPIWMIIIKFLIFIFSLIKSRLLEIAILAQITALVYYLTRHYFRPHAIILRKHNDLVLKEHEIVIREKYQILNNK